MKNNFLPTAYLKNKFVPFRDAQISIATHALHYGTAAFAGMRVYPDPKKQENVVLFRPELHFKRLSNSAKLLGYEISAKQIGKAVSEFISVNPGDHPYYLRPLIYASDLGIAPRLHDIEFDLLIYGIKMGQYLDGGGISCCFSSWVRGEDRSMPLRGKISGTYVSSALAKTEAVNRGFDEAIFLNSRGKIAEGSAMNLFIVKDGVLVTPSVTQDILEGITRRSILELANEMGIPVEEREIDKSEVILAEEAFLTGTAAQLAPINKLEQYTLPNERPVTLKIKSALEKIQNRQNSKHADWLMSLPAKH